MTLAVLVSLALALVVRVWNLDQKNLWLDDTRAGWRREVATSNDVLEAVRGGDAEAESAARLQLGSVLQHIDRLPDAQRTVLLLVSVEGLSYKEAADVLEVPQGTLTSRLGRGRAALLAELAETVA